MLMLDGENGALADRIFGVSDIMMLTHAKAMLALGADIPMCLLSRPARARGRGEKLDFFDLPPVPAVLVNPRVPVSTAGVFAALDGAFGPPMPEVLPKLDDAAELIAFAASCRNDLEAPAIGMAPVISEVLGSLSKQPGCGLARMSGSGATCFGLFERVEDAKVATGKLTRDRPDWWVSGGVLGNQMELAMPSSG
jgi:4-diphosphocytidyl-2-C-methyl-D-erythritol kinase